MIDRYWQDWTAFMLSMSSFYCTSSPHQKPDEWKTTDPKKVEWPVMTRSGMVSGSGISIAQGLEELRRSEELSGLISGPFESMRHLTSKTSSFTSSNNQRLLVLRCFQAMYVIHPRRCLKFIFSLMLHVKHKARTGTTTGSFEASMSCSVSQNLMTCCSCTKDVLLSTAPNPPRETRTWLPNDLVLGDFVSLQCLSTHRPAVTIKPHRDISNLIAFPLHTGKKRIHPFSKCHCHKAVVAVFPFA